MMTPDQPSQPTDTYQEITISVYCMTTDRSLAARIAETFGRIAAGFALEGGVDTAVRVGTCDADPDCVYEEEI